MPCGSRPAWGLGCGVGFRCGFQKNLRHTKSAQNQNHNRLPSVLIRRMCYLCRLFRVTHARVLKYSRRRVVHGIRWAFELRRPAPENSLPYSFALKEPCFKRTIIIMLLEKGTLFNTFSSCSTNLLSKGACAKPQYGWQLCVQLCLSKPINL